MRIGFVSDWNKNKATTWSGIPFSLLQALRGNGCECVDLDISLSRLGLLYQKIKYARIIDGKLKSKYRFASRYFAQLQRKLLKRVRENPKLDAVLQIGDCGIPSDIPLYIYMDLSVDVLIKHYESYQRGMVQFEMYSREELYRRVEWQKRVFERCSGIFTMSAWLAKSLAEDSAIPPSKIHVVHGGVNVQPMEREENTDSSASGPKLLFVGRDFYRKGGDLVVEAFTLLRKHHAPSATLVVAGPRTWPLKDPIPDGVEFLGDAPWQVLQQYYLDADIFCMPSRWEGFGIVFAEALCFGIPCIARDAGVMKEIITPGVNGFLLQKDDPHKLTELILRLWKDTNIRQQVRESVPQYRKYYSWSRVASDMVKVIAADRMVA